MYIHTYIHTYINMHTYIHTYIHSRSCNFAHGEHERRSPIPPPPPNAEHSKLRLCEHFQRYADISFMFINFISNCSCVSNFSNVLIFLVFLFVCGVSCRGHCQFGDRCNFAHGLHELKVHPLCVCVCVCARAQCLPTSPPLPPRARSLSFSL